MALDVTVDLIDAMICSDLAGDVLVLKYVDDVCGMLSYDYL